MMNLTPRLNRVERNLLIDGGMQIWPEGTSRTFTAGNTGYGACLMRVYNDASSAVTLTNSRQTSVPSNTNLIYSNQVSKTATGTLAAGSAHGLIYNMEGYDTEEIWLNEFSVIFFVKSSVASNRSLSLRNGAATHSYVRQYNIAQANAWEMKVLRFDGLNTCPGTVDRTNGLGMQFLFNIVAGTNFQTSTLNAWQAANRFSGIGEDTTWLTGTNHDFSVAGIMILPGNWEGLTSAQYQFVRAGRNFQDELAMTQRFYEKTYDLETAPGSLVFNGAHRFNHPGSVGVEGNYYFRVTKRATPTITFYSPQSGAAGVFRDTTNAVDRSTATLTAVGTGNFSFSTAGVPGGAPDISGHIVADARF